MNPALVDLTNETPHSLASDVWRDAELGHDVRNRAIAWRRGCRVNPAWRVVAVEISNERAVSALGVTAERDGWGQLIVAVGHIHTAESFPDSLRQTRY